MISDVNAGQAGTNPSDVARRLRDAANAWQSYDERERAVRVLSAEDGMDAPSL